MNADRIITPKQELLSTDDDNHYTWGQPPTTYLPFRAIVRLTILRSRLETPGQPAQQELQSPKTLTMELSALNLAPGTCGPTGL